MQMRQQSLCSNLTLHNIREMLEKLSGSEDVLEISELVELSLLNQSKQHQTSFFTG
jgi:hypothetical protein